MLKNWPELDRVDSGVANDEDLECESEGSEGRRLVGEIVENVFEAEGMRGIVLLFGKLDENAGSTGDDKSMPTGFVADVNAGDNSRGGKSGGAGSSSIFVCGVWAGVGSGGAASLFDAGTASLSAFPLFDLLCFFCPPPPTMLILRTLPMKPRPPSFSFVSLPWLSPDAKPTILSPAAEPIDAEPFEVEFVAPDTVRSISAALTAPRALSPGAVAAPELSYI